MTTVKGLLLQIPGVINTRICKNGTVIEYAKNGRKMYTFGTKTPPYKAGFTQMEVTRSQPYDCVRITMFRDGKPIMQAGKEFSPKENAPVYSSSPNPFKNIAKYIREKLSIL